MTVSISDLHRGHYTQTKINRESVVYTDLTWTTTTMTTTAGDWIAAGFLPGDGITISSASIAGNNSEYVILSITGGTNNIITITAPSFTAGGAGTGSATTSSDTTRSMAGTEDMADFTLNYRQLYGREWSYDDTTKIFTYEGDHSVIHRVDWSINVAKISGAVQPLLTIGLKRNQLIDTPSVYTPIEWTKAYRTFSNNSYGHFGSNFLLRVDVGDTFKMGVSADAAFVLDVYNLLISFDVNDVIS